MRKKTVFVALIIMFISVVAFAEDSKQKAIRLIAEGDKITQSAKQGFQKAKNYSTTAAQEYNKAKDIAVKWKKMRPGPDKDNLKKQALAAYNNSQKYFALSHNMHESAQTLQESAARKYYEAKVLGDFGLQLEEKIKVAGEYLNDYKKEVIAAANYVKEIKDAIKEAVTW